MKYIRHIYFFDLCKCGCGEIVYNIRQYRQGHNSRTNNPFKGRHHTKDVIKIVENNLVKGRGWQKGKNISENTYPNYGMRGKSHTKESNQKNSEKYIGKPLYRPRRSDLWYSSLNNDKLCFRSSWELFFAKYLDSIQELWDYEPKQFHLGSMTYTLDFYLKNPDLYIEIKGHWMRGYKEKFDKFKQQYPTTDIVVIEHSPPYELLGLFKHTDTEQDVV